MVVFQGFLVFSCFFDVVDGDDVDVFECQSIFVKIEMGDAVVSTYVCVQCLETFSVVLDFRLRAFCAEVDVIFVRGIAVRVPEFKSSFLVMGKENPMFARVVLFGSVNNHTGIWFTYNFIYML